MPRIKLGEEAFAGVALRMRRNELGLSQTDVANALGITFQQVQKYENGTNQMSAGRLAAAAEFLQVPIAYFVDRSSLDRAEISLLRSSGAVDLLRSYGQIQRPEHRETVLQLARSLERK